MRRSKGFSARKKTVKPHIFIERDSGGFYWAAYDHDGGWDGYKNLSDLIKTLKPAK